MCLCQIEVIMSSSASAPVATSAPPVAMHEALGEKFRAPRKGGVEIIGSCECAAEGSRLEVGGLGVTT